MTLGCPWFPNLDTMLATDRPDGAIIATPNQMHVAHGLQVLDAGCPLLVEKPLADTSAEAIKLVQAAEAAGQPLLVGHHRRHNPLIAAAKARIEGGALGRIVAVQGTCWLYKPDDYFQTPWRRQKGAGPVFINLIHDIDLMRHLVGEISAVQAVESRDTRGHEVEDTAAILLHFAHGALGTLSVSDTIVAPWSWELTAAENPAYPATGQTCYTIGGTAGSLELPRGALWSQDAPRSWWSPIDRDAGQPPGSEPDPLDLQIDHFCDVIEGKASPRVPGREGLRSLQVIEAIKKAAETGERTMLDLTAYQPTDV